MLEILTLANGCQEDQIIVDRSPNCQALRNHDNARHRLLVLESPSCVARNRSAIVCQQDSVITCCPFENSGIGARLHSKISQSHDIDVRNATSQAFQESLVEVGVSDEARPRRGQRVDLFKSRCRRSFEGESLITRFCSRSASRSLSAM